MLECPDKSLPTQNANWSDLKAAYRLFNNPNVTFDAVAESHWQQTRQTKPGRYLLVSDTTEIDHFSHRATTGLSQLGKGTGRGMQLHSSLMVDASDGDVIGIAGGLLHYRMDVPKNETRTERLNRYRESDVWGVLVEDIGCPPPGCQWIHVFDRGGDNFEAMCHLRHNRSDWVIRASKLNRHVITADGKIMPLSKAIKSAEIMGTYDLYLRARPNQAARTAKIQVSTTKVSLQRPKQSSSFVKQSGITSIEVNVVIVQEVNAPKGVKPICWILITSLPVETFEAAWDVITYYEYRWLIEEYHKVLKTGCSIENHALKTAERLEPLIGLISVIGVRLLQLKTIAKKEPETKAVKRIPTNWLSALKAIRTQINIATITVREFFRELAKLGGFLGRKSDGEPGWQTTWRGYMKLQMILIGMQLTNKQIK
jgi:hypothetical protein